MSNSVLIISEPEERRLACSAITELLPDWFGQEDSNIQYREDAVRLNACGIYDNNTLVALLVYEQLKDEILKCNVLNIHWLGIMPQHHRRGFGRNLIDFVQNEVCKDNINTLTVETLSPEANDRDYLKTFAFYKAMGFEIYDYFKYNEDDKNPMVRMVKYL